MIADDVSSKYSRRGPEEYARVAGHIHRMVEGKKGNYIAFFPSYKVMEDVFEKFKNLYGESAEGLRLIRQKANMTQEKREEFLAEFKAGEKKESLLAFCVMGGIFSEGIDLKEDALIGAAIYGTGIPQVDIERKILQDYYDREERKGFAYSYQYPGMNKVLQAAGRVIRTIDDRGVILLMDERFLRYDYRKLFPKEWTSYKRVSLKTSEKEIRDFWEKEKTETGSRKRRE